MLGVVYSADSVDELIPSVPEAAAYPAATPGGALALYYARHLKPYTASVNDGVKLTIEAVHAVLSNCPETELVLAGYSQGAMAVHQAEQKLEHEGDEEALDAIGGTLLLGDGNRAPNTQAKIFGGAPQGDEGVRVYLHGVKASDVVEPETTAEICVTGDIVCDFKLHGGRVPRPGTRMPPTSTLITTNDNLPQKVYLRKAVEWLAEEMGLTE